jgi:hypothetical protein
VNVWDAANRLVATATAPNVACSASMTHSYNGDGLWTLSEHYCSGSGQKSFYQLFDLAAPLPVVLAETATCSSR